MARNHPSRQTRTSRPAPRKPASDQPRVLPTRKLLEDQHHLIVEAAPIGLVVIDREGIIQLVNAQTEKLFGYRREELLGQPVEMLLPQRFRANHPGHRTGFLTDPRSRMMGAGRDRLEEFPRSAVERVGPKEVVQYRDAILPLLHVSRILGRRRRPVNNRRSESPRQAHNAPAVNEGGPVQVVVIADKGRRVGLVVDHILDIVEEALVSRSNAHHPGVLFTAVLQGRVTEFLDIESILCSATPTGLDQPRTIAAEA